MKITIFGTGSWGTALAKVLCDNKHNVTLWGRDENYIKKISKSRCNERYFKNFILPKNLKLSSDFGKNFIDCDFIINAIPVQYTRQLLERIKKSCVKVPPIINSSKGVELGSHERISEIVEKIFGNQHAFAVISGPSHAEEVIRQLPTTLVIASKDDDLCKKVQISLMNRTMRIYTQSDIIGVEFGGALKNIFAIAAGVIDGIGLGDNTKAALITRGIAEMTRIGVFLGGKKETFSGLSGLGDLIVTSMSKFSRNRFVGESLGQGVKLEKIQKAMGFSVAEGITTVKSIYELTKKHNIYAPIVEESYKVIYQKADVKKALGNLMMRKAKNEY